MGNQSSNYRQPLKHVHIPMQEYPPNLPLWIILFDDNQKNEIEVSFGGFYGPSGDLGLPGKFFPETEEQYLLRIEPILKKNFQNGIEYQFDYKYYTIQYDIYYDKNLSDDQIWDKLVQYTDLRSDTLNEWNLLLQSYDNNDITLSELEKEGSNLLSSIEQLTDVNT